jgi:hypothetical protein
VVVVTKWVRCLEFTTAASCAVNCSYCPQGVLKDAYRGETELSLGAFRRVVDRLPVDVVVHFSGFVEPWLNAHATEMLECALGLGRRVSVYTTTIGMRTPRIVAELLTGYRDQVDHICIHLPDVLGHMPLKPKPEAIDAFRTVPGVEWMAMGKAVEEPGPMNAWEPNDRAGSLSVALPILGRTRHVGPIRCSYTPTYEHSVMLPNGNVVLCCQDYGLRAPIGNLFRQTWDELDRASIARANLDGVDTICRRCNGAEAT